MINLGGKPNWKWWDEDERVYTRAFVKVKFIETIMQVSEIKLRPSGLAASAFTGWTVSSDQLFFYWNRLFNVFRLALNLLCRPRFASNSWSSWFHFHVDYRTALPYPSLEMGIYLTSKQNYYWDTVIIDIWGISYIMVTGRGGCGGRTHFSLRGYPPGVWPCSSDYMYNANWIFFLICETARVRKQTLEDWRVKVCEYLVWNYKIVNKNIMLKAN